MERQYSVREDIENQPAGYGAVASQPLALMASLDKRNLMLDTASFIDTDDAGTSNHTYLQKSASRPP